MTGVSWAQGEENGGSQAQDRLPGVGLLCSHDLGDGVGVVVVPQSVSVTSAESDVGSQGGQAILCWKYPCLCDLCLGCPEVGWWVTADGSRRLASDQSRRHLLAEPPLARGSSS